MGAGSLWPAISILPPSYSPVLVLGANQLNFDVTNIFAGSRTERPCRCLPAAPPVISMYPTVEILDVVYPSYPTGPVIGSLLWPWRKAHLLGAWKQWFFWGQISSFLT